MKFFIFFFFVVAATFGQLGVGLQSKFSSGCLTVDPLSTQNPFSPLKCSFSAGVLGTGANTQIGAGPGGIGANTGLGTPVGGATGGLGLGK